MPENTVSKQVILKVPTKVNLESIINEADSNIAILEINKDIFDKANDILIKNGTNVQNELYKMLNCIISDRDF